MIRRIGIVLCLIVLVLGFYKPARATSWLCVWLGDAGLDSATVVYGTYSAGNVFTENTGNNVNDEWAGVSIAFTGTITDVSFHITAHNPDDPGSGSMGVAYDTAPENENLLTETTPSGDASAIVSWTGSQAVTSEFSVFMSNRDHLHQHLGYITFIQAQGDGTSPCSNPIASPPAATKYQPCPTSNDNGVLPGSWTYTPPVTPDPSGVGLALNGSVIQKNFSLSRYHEYSMRLSYKLSTAGPSESFTFAFGKNFTIQLVTTEDDTEDTVNIPASSYEPTTSAAGADVYVLAIGAISPPVSPHLVITYFCLTDETTGAVTGSGTGGAPQASCKDCVYNATGDLIADVLGVLKWIWCGLSQLWDCTIKSLFYGIWKFVGVIITALAFLRQWAGLVFQNGSTWLGAVVPILWNFIRGLAGNIILTAFNALAGVFNALGITGIINAILAFLNNIPGAISQFLSFVPGVVSLISTIWDFITYWVSTTWSLVSGILGAIPVVFASVVDGFNQSAASIPVYAPTCNSSNTLFFGPCLGMYIIDNTVFDGPMFYVFPVVLGFIALNTILWSIEKFKEALSGD